MKFNKLSVALFSLGLAFSSFVMSAPSGKVQSGAINIEEAYNADVKSQIEAKKSEIKMDKLRLTIRNISALHGIVGIPREDWYRIRVKK